MPAYEDRFKSDAMETLELHPVVLEIDDYLRRDGKAGERILRDFRQFINGLRKGIKKLEDQNGR